MTKLKAILAALGLGALASANSLLELIAPLLNLPPYYSTLPGWGKIVAILLGVGGLVLAAAKTSESNPDGTPATSEWKP
jgi:hypothetical protein